MNCPMCLNNYCYIILNYMSALQHQDLWHYLLVCYFTYVVGKRGPFFNYYLFIVSICCYYCCICFFFKNCYSFLNKYVCITVITKTRLQHCSLKSIWLLVINVPFASSVISTQLFVLNLESWVASLLNKFVIFWCFTYFIHINIG